jgi:hypothetical protein
MMDSRRIAGNTVAGLVALLAILVAAGGGNYVRNFQADQASESQRPFHTYQQADLEALRAAYEAEVTHSQTSYDRRKAGRRRSGGAVMMDEAVAEFDRARAHADNLRELGSQVTERETRVREIDLELTKRAEIGTGWQAHMRRLIRI